MRELTGGEGVDFAYEAVGRAAAVEQAVRMLAHGGTATVIGVPAPGQQVSFDLQRELFDRRATIRVSYGGDQLPAEDFPLLAGLALEGKLDLERGDAGDHPLEEVEAAFRDLQAGEVIRTVILFDA